MMQFDPEDFRDPQEQARFTLLLGSLMAEDHELVDPPDDVWAGIAARVEGDRPVAERRATVVDSAAEPRSATVVDLDARRRRPRFLAAAASVVVVVGIGVGIGIVSSNNGPRERLLASTELRQLEPLGETRASAKLVKEGGATHLIIDAEAMAPAPTGTDYELWLLGADGTDPHSLGTVTGSGDIVVPPSIDPEKYPVVDISLEPKDGNHLHSGHSLMRGRLE